MIWLAAVFLFAMVASASAQQGHDMSQSAQHEHDTTRSAQHRHGAPAMAPESCDLGIRLTEAAERRLGGALYAQATAVTHAGGTHDERHAGGTHDQHAAPAGEGTHDQGTHASAKSPPMHERHDPQHGGEQFFMAPNKRHHIEPAYSEDCGLRVIVYNAHSEPIRPDRFRAFVRVIPSARMEPERMRFLEVSADGTVLEASLGPELSRPFEAELYVRFPESDEPELFNVLITP